ncbi:hypothetical protein D1872_38160 [compost metagenome]
MEIIKKIIAFDYTNWKGDTYWRRAYIADVIWDSTEYHPEKQFLAVAYDIDKREERLFAIKGMSQLVEKHITITGDHKYIEFLLKHNTRSMTEDDVKSFMRYVESMMMSHSDYKQDQDHTNSDSIIIKRSDEKIITMREFFI